MSFSELGLNPLLVRNLETMGYHTPRPVQAQAIGPVIEGRDVIGLAQTGMGKTAAYGCSIAHLLLANPTGGDAADKRQRRKTGAPAPDRQARFRALILCPTRELAQQVTTEIRAITANTSLRAVCVFGKVGMLPQVADIARGLDILVGTPGRCRELLEAGEVSFDHVRHVVVDEADRMLDMGFLPQVGQLLERVPVEDARERPRQVLMFSATMPPEIESLAGHFQRGAVRVEIGRHTTPVGHVDQQAIRVDDRDKVDLLLKRASADLGSGILIFCATRRRVGWVGTALRRNGLNAGMIHGDRTQAQRQRTLSRFTQGAIPIVVATDVAGRGLHIPAVHTVVNYDLPATPEDYVHRIGRAGHGGSTGRAISLVSARDEEAWTALAEMLELDIPFVVDPDFMPRGLTTTREDRTERVPDDRKTKRRRGKGGRGAKDSTPRVNKSGNMVRRSNRSRRVDRTERPGGGVRRPNNNG